MENKIKQSLTEISEQFGVRVLYACESGSRAWGFASPDSDYDARFIYVHPQDYYLGIDERRDVIELPINDLLDINGWDLRKALRLFRKSNAPLFEWLQSPIIYSQQNGFASELKNLIPQYFSPRATMHHYLSMAKGVFESDLSSETVKLKKYFYALRPILACRWIANNGNVPPMELGRLRAILKNNLQGIVDDLLAQKSQADEKVMIKSIMELNDFIRDEIAYCESNVPATSSTTVDSTPLNILFRKYIQ
jgi:predicted nucleotidyltransferase